MSNYPNRQYPSNGEATPVGSYPAYPSAPSSYGGGSNLDIKRSFNQLLSLLKRGAWLIAIVFVVISSLVAVGTMFMKPEYSASTLLLLSNNSSTPNQDALDFGKVEAAGMDASKSTQTLILQESILIAERTVERLLQEGKIKGTDIEFTFLKEKEDLTKKLGIEPTVTDWAKYVQENYINIRPQGDFQTGGIRIEVRSEHPTEAAQIANTYADEYKRFSQEMGRQNIVQSKAFLEDQIDKHKEDLREIEDQISEYQRSQSAVSLEAASNLTVTEIASLEAMLNQTKVDKRMIDIGITAKQEQLDAMTPALSQGVSDNLEEELAKVRLRMTEIEDKLEPIYRANPELRDDPSGQPFVLGMTETLASYRKQFRTLSDRYASAITPGNGTSVGGAGGVAYASTLKSEVENDKVVSRQLASKISELNRAIRSSSGKLRAIPTKSQDMAQLERQRQSAEASYLNLTGKLQEVNIAEESKVGFAEILRPAFIPSDPDKPNKPRNIALGLLLGLVMGVGAAIVRHWMDSKIYAPDDITSKGITLLGAVPNMAEVIKTEFNGAKTAPYKGMEVSTGLATLLTPSSPTAEAYRRLYVNLQFSMPDRVVQTILVTSPEASVGKSTTSLNLAITAAKAKRKTLIIDADFHRPAVGRYLGLRQGPDLPKLLDIIDTSEAGERFDPMMNGGAKKAAKSARIEGIDLEKYKTKIDNLYAIAPDQPMPDAAEQLGSREFRVLLQRLREVFDVIIIDTPPVLLTADAAIVSTQADATIVVAAAGMTDSQALDHSMGELNSIGANVLGAVINRFDPSTVPGYKSTYKYRYQYYNEYYRGDRAEKLATT